MVTAWMKSKAAIMTIFLSLPCPFMARIHPLASFDFRLKRALDSYWYTVWLMTGAIRKELCLIRSTSGKSSSIPKKCYHSSVLTIISWAILCTSIGLGEILNSVIRSLIWVLYVVWFQTVIETIIHFEKHPTLTLKAQK